MSSSSFAAINKSPSSHTSLAHGLSRDEVDHYRTTVKMWLDVIQNFHKNLKTNYLASVDRSNAAAIPHILRPKLAVWNASNVPMPSIYAGIRDLRSLLGINDDEECAELRKCIDYIDNLNIHKNKGSGQPSVDERACNYRMIGRWRAKNVWGIKCLYAFVWLGEKAAVVGGAHQSDAEGEVVASLLRHFLYALGLNSSGAPVAKMFPGSSANSPPLLPIKPAVTMYMFIACMSLYRAQLRSMKKIRQMRIDSGGLRGKLLARWYREKQEKKYMEECRKAERQRQKTAEGKVPVKESEGEERMQTVNIDEVLEILVEFVKEKIGDAI